MNAIYSRLQNTSSRLLSSYGTSITITRKNAVENPESGVGNGAAATIGTFTAVNPPASDGKSSFDNDIMREAAGIGKMARFFVVAALNAPFIPASDDIVTVDSVNLVILGCTPIAPAGAASAVCYKIGAAA